MEKIKSEIINNSKTIKKYKLVKNTEKINKEYDGFLNENCSICGRSFKKVDDILVYVDKDTYVCKSCANKYELETYECASPYSEEEI